MINRDNPLYIKVRDHITNMILIGELNPGDKLPSENVLADDLKISRSTLRDSLRMLEERKIIIKKHGIGTFIAPKNILQYSIQEYLSSTSLIQSMGMKPGTILKEIFLKKPDTLVKERLNLDNDDDIYEIDRVRTADGKPILYSIEYVPKKILSCEINTMTLGESLVDFFREKCNLKISWTLTTLLPGLADKTIGKLLKIPQGSLLLIMVHSDFNNANEPVCFAKEYFNSDEFEFRISRNWSR
ncbi:MAG: GntR family transcriptional regulator [Actinobacteria bacterium]|nr:GntR family transcriptional regulator [Actinomycetota bacterium]